MLINIHNKSNMIKQASLFIFILPFLTADCKSTLTFKLCIAQSFFFNLQIYTSDTVRLGMQRNKFMIYF